MPSHTNFLQLLATDVSEPFVIPNVSPTSPQFPPNDNMLSPVTDGSIARERKISVIELN
ncbi:hypothetical protein METSCH_B12400 [Metschnikowia aff. pulcherrima]|uniref:Uncharacterized protein n=1 Tax=Metschnikowia aff. pulcherrima TaxID=2163413 RepID=A0A4P6XQK7_9ASCO|nr:hypothetical protein METSCH_B12400 [Metschnikowia aff. pulcherrima]